jgi:hypothetical protein
LLAVPGGGVTGGITGGGVAKAIVKIHDDPRKSTTNRKIIELVLFLNG